TTLVRPCPPCNLAREAATLPLVTRGGDAAPIPLGKLRSSVPLPAPAGGPTPHGSRRHEPTQPPRRRPAGKDRPAPPTAVRPRPAPDRHPPPRGRHRRAFRHAHGLRPGRQRTARSCGRRRRVTRPRPAFRGQLV